MRQLMLVLISAVLAACGSASSPYDAADQFIVDATVIDVADAVVQPDMTVVIRDGRILAVEPASDTKLPAGANIVHRGGFVMPGLWDMHVHSLSDPDDAVDRLLPLYIAHGITGIRDMGSLVDGIKATRDRLAGDASIPAPEIIAAGPLLDGVRLPWYGDLPLVLTDAAEVDAALTRLVDEGVDFFKVYDQLSSEVYAAILEFAASRNIPVAGHPPRAIGITEAAASGQSTIEHLSLFTLGDCVAEPDVWFERALAAQFGESGYPGYYKLVLEFFAEADGPACAGAIQSLVDNQTYYTPTLVMEMNDRGRIDTTDLAWLNPDSRSWCNTTLDGIEAADPELREAAFSAFATFTLRLHEAGVEFLAGSDNPNFCLVTGASLHWELERLVEAGLSPLAALETATVNPARALGREAEEGRIKPAYHANLVVLDANPLDDIRNTRTIVGVFRAGRWVDAAHIARIREASRP